MLNGVVSPDKIAQVGTFTAGRIAIVNGSPHVVRGSYWAPVNITDIKNYTITATPLVAGSLEGAGVPPVTAEQQMFVDSVIWS